MGGSATPAWAACSTTDPYAGVYYYTNTGCSSLWFSYNGDTMQNFGAGLSSLNLGVADGGGSWRVYLHTGAGSTGSTIGLSNASTTTRKSYDLTNFGLGGGTWNDAARSLCQIRVVGTSSPC